MGATTTASQGAGTAADATVSSTQGWCSSATKEVAIWWEISTPNQLYLVKEIEVTVDDLDATVETQKQWSDSTWTKITLQVRDKTLN